MNMKEIKKINSVEELNTTIKNKALLRKDQQKAVLFVSAGTCGQARGSLKVIEALEEEIEAQNLKDKVLVKVSGCHGFCEAEPNIIIQPQNIFYQHVEPKHAKDIISETIINNTVIDSLLYTDPISKNKVRKEADIDFYKKQKRIVMGDNALIDPTDIFDYMSVKGYSSLAKILESMSPEDVIETTLKSGLLSM